MIAKVYKYTKVHDTPDGMFGETYYSDHKLVTDEQAKLVTECGLAGLLFRGKVNVMFDLPQDLVEYVPAE